MNRWILQLFLSIAAAISPLSAAFVTPHACNNPKANAASSVMNDRAPCLFNERIPREENNPHINATQPNEEPEKAPKRTNKPSDPRGLLFRQQQTADPFRADFRDSSEPRLMTTFAGGTSLMFEMIAKRMLDWGNEAKPFDLESEKIVTGVLPRWHPHPGISDANPDFRKLPPAMNNQGRRFKEHCIISFGSNQISNKSAIFYRICEKYMAKCEETQQTQCMEKCLAHL